MVPDTESDSGPLVCVFCAWSQCAPIKLVYGKFEALVFGGHRH
jgi:hypothetical protein